jgi:NAD(P)-dependent dehydrogenase (short-subunit alcohol dehydrogenase family)
MTDLKGRHAVVSGGGQGIGRAIAHALSVSGARVTVLGRSAGPLEDAVRTGDAAAHMILDVTDEAAVLRVAAALGPVDILVNNAGSAETAPFRKAGSGQFRRMIDVHLMGAVHLTRPLLAGMVERGFGRIVNIASTAALKGYPYVSAYSAAKHALLGLTRALAVEVARSGVTVNAVCPGYTETDLVTGSLARTAVKTGRSEAVLLAEMLADKPLGRLVRPEEVAAAVLFLCGQASGAVTGQAIPVDGGETVR